jgi:alpha-ribazole phosphatase
MLVVWRHPKPVGVDNLLRGCCIGGGTELPVDPRRAKRLAHRIRAHARSRGVPREVWTSPLERCAAVGRCLRRFGFVHRISPDLRELHFGAWEGRPWADIGREAIDAWTADFAQHAPGGGEPLAALFERVKRFQADHPGAVLVVGHAGWMNAWRWIHERGNAVPTAAAWPVAVAYTRQACVAVTRTAGAQGA